MILFNSYNGYLNFISIVCELSLVWCFILFLIYVCFIYFNNYYIYKQPIACLFFFSFLTIGYLILNSNNIYTDLFGGTFSIYASDIVVRNIIFLILFVVIYHVSLSVISLCGIVYSIEYYILIYILIISSIFVLYCSDIISLFLFIELQSMVVYVLICLKYNINSVSIGIRYFIVGTMVSLIFLFSFSMIYYCTGISGFLDFMLLKLFLDDLYMYVLITLVYTLFMLKIYIFPFHFIGGDLYRWSPLNILMLLSTVLYYIYIYLFMKVLMCYVSISYILYIFIFLTLAYGVLNILIQRDIRSFLGFGTSIHSSLVLVLITSEIQINMSISMFYVFVYVISILNILLIISKFNYIDLGISVISSKFNVLSTFQYSNILRLGYLNYYNIEYISSWAGLFKYYKHLTVLFSICLWSIAGLPPFSGFFVKLSILAICFVSNHLLLFFFIILISIISSLYYVKIIKEFFYIKASNTYYTDLSDIDYIFILFFTYLCVLGIFIPELFIYIFY
jgi:NADH:ubiquinone oxidoreductase subunit 2 (subunit N)